ncbi:putative pentatricopeptide repeat-containing protein At1g77010, mitochondrial [Syzygium oleosum]|uniref:putative pentatricopeptide repeat-containing protein At1g77010, mitochondrial n=1 Tax=Syzygium oleosum TaxID=219896 RepID=UPI0024BB8D85|nr:putative pentatricopeptide repeat-containing protein At1g77010, mitochondrial [Syzygium oleosum]XP_056161935.1 putative pentatricopeptide repeat-containing protein At1g77010, mitochondrial [Syzygium oleosum]
MDMDVQTCGHLLQSCITRLSVHEGKQLHLLFLKKGLLNCAITLGNRLLQLYAKCGQMDNARRLFDDMPQRNCFTWNTMVEGYMRTGEAAKSLELFSYMPYRNDFSWNVVISGFAKRGDLRTVSCLFNAMSRKNAVAWNSMIHGYAKSGRSREALRFFKDMNSDPFERMQGDTFVLATVIGACSDLEAIDCGKQIHARLLIDRVAFDSVLASSLVNLYGKCGDLDSANRVLSSMDEPNDFSLSALISGYANCGKMDEARRVFSSSNNPCVVSWNSLIAGHVANNEEMEALVLFNKMREEAVREDASTVASILSACSSLGVLVQGKLMHAHASKSGLLNEIIVASALVDVYYKCGSLRDACDLFDELEVHDTILLNSMITVYSNCGKVDDAKEIFKSMSKKSLISWNSMLVGLSQNGCPVEALDLFCEMNRLGLMMDKFSFASVLSSCAVISSFDLGEQIFGRAIVIGLEHDPIISTSLVDFFCKCGHVEKGRKVFNGMVKMDEVSWNTMLMGYATNGHGMKALSLFEELRHAGLRPTDITFTAVLSACDHCGLVEEGWKWLYAMKLDYDIDPTIDHYSCVIDLFARAGYLNEAIDLIEQMPFDADTTMWSSVLRGCVAHGNRTLGKKVAEQIIKLDPENSGAYVQLSGILADIGDWERSAEVRYMMKEKQVGKDPGCSWADC